MVVVPAVVGGVGWVVRSVWKAMIESKDAEIAQARKERDDARAEVRAMQEQSMSLLREHLPLSTKLADLMERVERKWPG